MHKITLVGKWASSVTQLVKNLPANAGDMRHTSLMLRSPDWEDPVEKEMTTHSSIPAKTTPWAEETGRLQSMGLQRVGEEQAGNAQEENSSISFYRKNWEVGTMKGKETFSILYFI